MASSGLIGTTGLAGLDRCATFGIDEEGFGDDACVVLVSTDSGSDTPTFSMIVSFRPLTG